MEGERDSVSDVLGRLGKELDTHTVFGEPKMLDGSAIIPVAKISYGGGGGGGGTAALDEEGAETTHPEGYGEGSGMGFGITAKPLGVIDVRHDSVRWVPVVDTTRLLTIWSVIAGLLLLTLVGGRRHH